MCMSVLPAYIVYHVHTMPRKPEEGIGSPGLELHSCELLFGCWELNLSPLEGQLLLLVIKPFL